MAAFPLQVRLEAQSHGESQEDNSLKARAQGGYTLARPRHTRPPRKSFTGGLPYLTRAEMTTLQSFYDTHGTHMIFTWINPTTSVVHNVRFKAPFRAVQIGYGTNSRFRVSDLEFEEA